jgi:hypothetical protein
MDIRQRRRQEGKCAECETLTEGTYYCLIHQERHRAFLMQSRIRSILKKKCVNCKEIAEEGSTRCKLHKELHRSCDMSRRDKYEMNGLCIDCGTPVDEEHILCIDCTTKHRKSEKILYDYRIQNNLCTDCGQPVKDYGLGYIPRRCINCSEKKSFNRLTKTIKPKTKRKRGSTLWNLFESMQ